MRLHPPGMSTVTQRALQAEAGAHTTLPLHPRMQTPSPARWSRQQRTPCSSSGKPTPHVDAANPPTAFAHTSQSAEQMSVEAPSCSYTSSARPPSWPLSSASIAASVSTRPPRLTLTMMAPGFILAMLHANSLGHPQLLLAFTAHMWEPHPIPSSGQLPGHSLPHCTSLWCSLQERLYSEHSSQC